MTKLKDTLENERRHDEVDQESQPSVSFWRRRRKALLLGFLALLLLTIGYAGYAYAASPAVIREPKLEHYHFRMQVVVNGQAEDFGSKAYQIGYNKDQCNGSLPEQPIHFHDNRDQFVHIHWEGMTGGMVMKYYGWNYIGGLDNALGYRTSDLSDIQKVTTHGDDSGNYLPNVPDGAKIYVYSGDENGYKERSFDDFKTQDLEQFFGTVSNFPAHKINTQQSSLLDKVFPKAFASGAGHDDGSNGGHGAAADGNQVDLKRINNLVGNVVLFAQKDKPTDQQIKDRFDALVPLTDSTCGG